MRESPGLTPNSLSAGVAENLPAEGVDLRRASILDDRALREAVDGCRFVFHQAAMVSVPQSVERPQECFSVNVMGTERVLWAARDAGVSRVVFAASAAAYGDEPQLPCHEDQLPRCCSPPTRPARSPARRCARSTAAASGSRR